MRNVRRGHHLLRIAEIAFETGATGRTLLVLHQNGQRLTVKQIG